MGTAYRNIANTMTLREKIGQTVMLRINSNWEKEHPDLEEFFDTYPLGGIFVGPEVIHDRNEDVGELKTFITRYEAASKIPLLFAADFENGCGRFYDHYTMFPTQMAIGAAGSEQLAYEYGKAVGAECRSLGINWTFSPVADLNVNPMSPVVNVRSISEYPELAIRLLKQIVKGRQEAGVAATIKHFPGDGMDYRDQHITTTENHLPLDEWNRLYGAVFKALIEEGAMAVMTGHITLPSYQTPDEDGRYLPATLSYELTTKLLKKELGFNGVVISDALNMGGFIKHCDTQAEAAVKCFAAGTDMLLWPVLEYFEELEKAILRGNIPMERLNDAVERILHLKQKLGILEPGYKRFEIFSSETAERSKRIADEIAKKSITLIKNDKGILPFHPQAAKKIMIIGITPHAPAFEKLTVFKHEFEKKGIEVTLKRNHDEIDLKQAEKEYDFIIYALYTQPHLPKGPLDFFDAEAGTVWNSLQYGRKKTVVVSFGSPYLLKQYFNNANGCIAAYSICQSSQVNAAKAIMGEIGFDGTAPVELDYVIEKVSPRHCQPDA